jgi:hypothetical protein
MIFTVNKRRHSYKYRGHFIALWLEKGWFDYLITRARGMKFVHYAPTSYMDINQAREYAENDVDIAINCNGERRPNRYSRRRESREYHGKPKEVK